MSRIGTTGFRSNRLYGTSFGDRIVRRIFRTVLTSGDFTIVFNDKDLGADLQTIHLRLPNLYRTIQILLKPDIMLGQAYVKGFWQVPPEQLYNFLHLIRSQEASKLQKWFLVSNRFHPLRDLFKQRFFAIRATRAVVEHYNTDPKFMSLILGPS